MSHIKASLLRTDLASPYDTEQWLLCLSFAFDFSWSSISVFVNVFFTRAVSGNSLFRIRTLFFFFVEVVVVCLLSMFCFFFPPLGRCIFLCGLIGWPEDGGEDGGLKLFSCLLCCKMEECIKRQRIITHGLSLCVLASL